MTVAYTKITPQTASLVGIAPTYNAVDATNGNRFANDGRTYAHIKNDDVSPTTFTFLAGGSYKGVGYEDQVVTVPAGEERVVAAFPMDVFNQATGEVYVDITNDTSVTMAVVKLSI
jgi:hypothetical protein